VQSISGVLLVGRGMWVSGVLSPMLTSALEVRFDFRPKKTGFTWKVQMRNPQLLKMVFLASAFLFASPWLTFFPAATEGLVL